MFEPSADPRRDRMVAIGLMCLVMVLFAGMDTSAKWLGQSMPPMQVVWARYVSSVIFVTILINPLARREVLRSRRPGLQMARSLLLFMSTALNFVALQYLQLVEVVAIIFTVPLLVALLGGPMLGEWVGPRRLAAIVVGFLGVLIVLRPGLGGLHPAALLSVVSVVCYAVYNIWTRLLAAHDSSETTMLYSGVVGVAAATPLMPWLWTPPETGLHWAVMALLGVLGGVGHYMLIIAHRLAPAGILAPYIYTQMIWMTILGYLVFDQIPDRWTLVGGLIVIASGLYLLYRERVRGVPDRPARLD